MLQRSVLKKAYILSSRQLSNRRERITADPVFRVREVFHARAKLSNNHEPSGDAQTFSGCHVGWNSCLSRQDSSDANCRHATHIFARTATEGVGGSRGYTLSALRADRNSRHRIDHPCFPQRPRTTSAPSPWQSLNPR